MKKQIYLFLNILLFSCSIESSILSESASKGIDDILKFYGGFCEYSVGKVVATDEPTTTYFEVKLSKSKGVEKFKKDSKFASSNIAYRLYRNLTKEEKSNYSEIRTIIIFESGITKKYSFKTNELETVDNKTKTVDLVVDYLKDKDFEKISTILNDSSVIEYDKDALITQMEKVDSKYGNITEEGFRIFGYRKVKYNRKYKKYLRISGAIIRDNNSNELSVVMDPEKENNEVLTLEYAM
ncbi:hypothetical protein [Flammeovirga agarivorans]|uniref:Lipoprotein n=1 Tax=Flammeovirga agarivorans TaxID=2726742 RepID=A0A7X8SRG9_9BACT|nr:hypothetical protein [Flammeovirga agarivorans]NLR95070.1 hypothetical protein [Flammeovirga agarivorans]